MRCLYCGKELALLKRWTGGGEFCSDAHRRRYQEEYNELALKRLLQAKPQDPPPDEEPTRSAFPTPPRGIAPIDKPAPPRMAEIPIRPAESAIRTPSETPRLETPVVKVPAYDSEQHLSASASSTEESPVVGNEPEAIAPADLTGFVIDLPDPSTAVAPSMTGPHMEFVAASEPELPIRGFAESSEIWLAEAGPAPLEPSSRAFDSPARPRAAGPESREFRASPITEFRQPATDQNQLGITAKAMETTIASYPPQSSPALWQAPEQEHSLWALELGALARLGFSTTGLEDHSESGEQAPRFVPALEPLVLGTEPPPPQEQFVPIEPERVEVQPAPILQAIVQQAAGELETQELRDSPVPQLVSTPMPLTVHGLTPGRSKPAQLFTTALSSNAPIQLPLSEGLPLRPVMVLGPAPVASVAPPVSVVDAKSESEPAVSLPSFAGRAGSKKSNGGQRSGNGKSRRSDVRIFEPEPVGQTSTPQGPALQTPALQSKVPAITPHVQSSAPAVVETPAVAVATPVLVNPAVGMPNFGQPSDADLGLPVLRGPSESAWSRIPIPVKIGVAAVLVLAVALTLYFTRRVTERPAPPRQRTVLAGQPLDLGIAGWISNFTGEPAGPRARQLNVLRGSLTLTDFRMEFQGVIENKSLGWVFRTRDPKNFYVMKLETVKPGLNPDVALVRFAVANGQEQARTIVPLPMQVRADTVYKVRLDAVGNRFTTWVQDRKIDEWTDTRINAGGVGLYYERGERGRLEHDITISPLSMQ